MNRYRLTAYGALGLPLAMAMMPIYMISPKFYGETIGLDLAIVGVILFATRLLDTAQDPFLGRMVDHFQTKRFGWVYIVALASVLLAVSFILLFSPPAWSTLGVSGWLIVCLVALYAAHSLLSICYITWGTRLSDEPLVRSRVVAWREGLGLVGVVLASVIPVVLVESVGARSGYQSFAWIFSLILLVCVCVTLLWSPRPERHDLKQGSNWKKALEDRSVRQIFFFYLLNAISVAIPATLVLFFIDDVVQRPQDAGIFLAAYFVAGIVTLPGWVALADRIGKRFAWLIGSGIAAAALAGASAVGAGDVLLYGLVCVAAGTALGADLALPASMLADAIPSAQRQNTGLYIGVWVLIGKLALAVAAGVTLPTLSFFDYQPGVPASVAPLITLYVFLPIVFKFAAAAVLILFVSPARANP